ncbi:unnamed protein product [Oppiella nova]|uniref:Uncharacterized protein n=1 Tax=Oppiella nova TaxID=334625 RepID=A0A7R9QJV2_9ACAR|nr:unnamed protein product [Oppiella nova]CAG2166749.1 unnamed protein product [Oppiella nova]
MVSIGGGYKWWSSVANHQRLPYLNGVHQTFEEPVLGVDGVADGVRAVHVVIGGVIDADVTQLVTQVVTHCLLNTKQESRTTSHYTCDGKSYFKKISRTEVERRDLIECNMVYQSPVNYTAIASADNFADIQLKISRTEVERRDLIECNMVYQSPVNYTAIASADNFADIQLKVIDSHFALRDVNGTELYSNVGVVVNEPCLGAIIYIYGYGKVTRGSCTGKTGVTEVSVIKDGLFSIRGTCDSTCWGSVNTVYNPEPAGTETMEGYMRTRLMSLYVCDKDSYFRKVNRTAQGFTDFKCNDIALDTNYYTIVGFKAKTNEEINLDVIDAYYALRDINGNEDYSNFGTIVSGVCKGGLVVIKDISLATEGACDANGGVTRVQSGPRDALLAIRGVCNSTCSGKVVVDYRPGKRH